MGEAERWRQAYDQACEERDQWGIRAERAEAALAQAQAAQAAVAERIAVLEAANKKLFGDLVLARHTPAADIKAAVEAMDRDGVLDRVEAWVNARQGGDATVKEVARALMECLPDAARAALPSAGAGDGWLPIESAPRDGTPILFWQKGCAIAETVCFLNGSKIVDHGWYPYAGGGWFVSEKRETGAVWRSLPDPPEQPPDDAPPDGDEGARR